MTIALTLFWLTAPVLEAGFGGTDLILPAVGRHFYTTAWITNQSPDESAAAQALARRTAALEQENADLRQRLERLEKILLDNQQK